MPARSTAFRRSTYLRSTIANHVLSLHSDFVVPAWRFRRQQWDDHVHGWLNDACQREHAPLSSFHTGRQSMVHGVGTTDRWGDGGDLHWPVFVGFSREVDFRMPSCYGGALD